MSHYLITITRRNGLRYKDAYFGSFSPDRGEYLMPSEGEGACYAKGWSPPNYPVPAIDYYSSTKRDHIPIGNLMEWYFDVDQVIYHRSKY